MSADSIADSKKNKGTLFLVGTPIGNIKDISQRAVEVLNFVDYIAAEDTRVTGILLKELGINKKMYSFHEHNKESAGKMTLRKLNSGENIAIVSDAGMPCVSDPGYEIVRKARENGFEIMVIPGPSALITALAGSGFDGSRFMFEGFLPVKNNERRERIEAISESDITIILYEAPHRLLKLLNELKDALGGDRNISIGRELTKTYEEQLNFTLSEGLNHFEQIKPKGEFVVVIEGKNISEKPVITDDEAVLLKEKITDMLLKGMKTKEILSEISAEAERLSRNQGYEMITEIKNSLNL